MGIPLGRDVLRGEVRRRVLRHLHRHGGAVAGGDAPRNADPVRPYGGSGPETAVHEGSGRPLGTLEVRELSVRAGRARLRAADLAVASGEVVAVVGDAGV